MLYFKAMCYKKLGKYVKANRDYNVLVQIFRAEEGRNMMNHMMNVVLLAFNKDRRLHFDAIEKLCGLLHVYAVSPPLSETK